MKNLFLIIPIFIVLISCEKDTEPGIQDLSINFGEGHAYVNDDTNAMLRPFLGFRSMGYTVGTTYTFYCDTQPTPTTVVHTSTATPFTYLMDCDLLKPNTQYYWYCKGEIDSTTIKGADQSEIYTFKTIDTVQVYNRTWGTPYIVTDSLYKTEVPWLHEKFQTRFASDEMMGQVESFQVTHDSVTNATYMLDPGGTYRTSGEFRFSLENVQIIDKKYKFINFGRAGEDYLELVLGIYGTDYLIVYISKM